MTETVTVHNTGASDLTLPCGTRIAARNSATVSVKALVDQRDNPVVRHWFGDGKTGILRPDAPVSGVGETGSTCDCLDVQSRLATALQDIAARDEAIASLDETIASLAAERDAAVAAKADSDGLLALAQDELAAKAAETGKAKKAA